MIFSKALQCLLLRAALLVLVLLASVTVRADVELLGMARIPGDASDMSQLPGLLAGDIPQNRFGGISAIEHVQGDCYLLLPDRGPADGATLWSCRYHEARIHVKLPRQMGEKPEVDVRIEATRLFRNNLNMVLTGSSGALSADRKLRDLRFDPEGIRRARGGRIFVSEEYGPSLCEFTPAGGFRTALQIPSHYLAEFSSALPEEENARNVSGRQANGGLEGLAITPDNLRLVAIMQRPLIQESLPTGLKRTGTNVRILEIALATGASREFLYKLEESANGISEILAINSHQFLVLERDSRAGMEAASKKVFLIDIHGATDLTGHAALPAVDIPHDVTPVGKTMFLDLLAPKFGFAGKDCPEKFEGLAFGPNLPDGRRLLLVTVDNDFVTEAATLILAFAVGRADLPDFGWNSVK